MKKNEKRGKYLHDYDYDQLLNTYLEEIDNYLQISGDKYYYEKNRKQLAKHVLEDKSNKEISPEVRKSIFRILEERRYVYDKNNTDPNSNEVLGNKVKIGKDKENYIPKSIIVSVKEEGENYTANIFYLLLKLLLKNGEEEQIYFKYQLYQILGLVNKYYSVKGSDYSNKTYQYVLDYLQLDYSIDDGKLKIPSNYNKEKVKTILREFYKISNNHISNKVMNALSPLKKLGKAKYDIVINSTILHTYIIPRDVEQIVIDAIVKEAGDKYKVAFDKNSVNNFDFEEKREYYGYINQKCVKELDNIKDVHLAYYFDINIKKIKEQILAFEHEYGYIINENISQLMQKYLLEKNILKLKNNECFRQRIGYNELSSDQFYKQIEYKMEIHKLLIDKLIKTV